jgi:hypothetical protein
VESAPQFCAISSLAPQESYQYKWPLAHFLEKLGVQSAPPESSATHWPEALQNSSAKQKPQFTVPPQLSFQTPHSLPSDEHVAGTHEETHWPEALQNSSVKQEPQFNVPPQLSFQTPHSLPSEEHVAGTHEETHWPETLQVCPEAQAPQVPPQPSEPQTLPEQLGAHDATHWLLVQVYPEAQVPQ